MRISDLADRPAKDSVIGKTVDGWSWASIGGSSTGYGYSGGYGRPSFVGKLSRRADGQTSGVVADIPLLDADQFCDLDLSMIAFNNNNSLYQEMQLGRSPDGLTCYAARWTLNTNLWALYRRQSGQSQVTLASRTLARSTPARLRLEATAAGALRLLYGADEILAATDPNPLAVAGGRAALIGFANSARAVGGSAWQADRFAAGALVQVPRQRIQQVTDPAGAVRELAIAGVWTGTTVQAVDLDGAFGSTAAAYGTYASTTY